MPRYSALGPERTKWGRRTRREIAARQSKLYGLLREKGTLANSGSRYRRLITTLRNLFGAMGPAISNV